MHLWSLTLSLSPKHTHTKKYTYTQTYILSLFLGHSANVVNVVCTQGTMSDGEKRKRREMKVVH